MGEIRILMFTVSCAAAAALLSGCVHANAKVTPVAQGLEVPAPPPHEVEAAEVEPEPPAPPPVPQEPVRRPPVRPRPATPPVAPPVGLPPGSTGGPAPSDPVKAPAPGALQAMPAGSEADVERAIRATIARANGSLKRVDYRVLNADARLQYDTARRFVQQAEDAVRLRNLVFAKNLADKADALSSQLAGR